MKVMCTLILKASLLCLVIHPSWVLAQEPLEMVTLNDKGGLLPPEDKNAKDDGSKNASAKGSALTKKTPALASAGKPGALSPSHASARSTYVVKPGDTLDKVIAQQYPEHAQKSEALRKELMAINPLAFSKGNPKMLLSGVSLKLPNLDQLLSKQAGNAGTTWSGEKANLSLSGYTSYPTVYANAESSEKRRHWVQYP